MVLSLMEKRDSEDDGEGGRRRKTEKVTKGKEGGTSYPEGAVPSMGVEKKAWKRAAGGAGYENSSLNAQGKSRKRKKGKSKFAGGKEQDLPLEKKTPQKRTQDSLMGWGGKSFRKVPQIQNKPFYIGPWEGGKVIKRGGGGH